MKRLLLLAGLLGLYQIGSTQEINISKIELAGPDVVIHYNLIDDNLDRKYALHLYSSLDDYIQPLALVAGDIDIDISVGGNKKVIWHAKEEMGEEFTGDVGLELKGSVYIPFISMDGFDDIGTFKRGKPYNLVWSGGRGDNVLNFELYRGENKIHSFEERPNVGNTALSIPTGVKPGKNYKLKISDTRNRDEVVYTGTFQLKRKIPLGLKLGITFVLGGAAGYFISRAGQKEKNIPLPILPSR